MDYEIIGRDNCPWCDKAIDLLITEGFAYTYVTINESPESLEKLKDLGLTTVPQVFHLDVRVGGYEDLVKHLEA